MKKKIAIIGGGISGIVAAEILSRYHEVELLEKCSSLGGHTKTISVKEEQQTLPIDIGFIVFNNKTYPNFTKFLSKLSVESLSSSMSFSVSNPKIDFEYNGSSISQLFGQKKNLLRIKFYSMLYEILRFSKIITKEFSHLSSNETVNDFFSRYTFKKSFLDHYLYPISCSIWSATSQSFINYPIKLVASFLIQHGMLSINDRPLWQVVKGGSSTYVRKWEKSFKGKILLNSKIKNVKRIRENNTLKIAISTHTENRLYDHIVFACHSDEALKTLVTPTQNERTFLNAFPYEKNSVTLHTCAKFMPKRRKLWGSWNFLSSDSKPKLTYYMNMLQSLETNIDYFVTLNSSHEIKENDKIYECEMSHPQFTKESYIYQNEDFHLSHEGISYCGAYLGYGFHEDGVKSALNVCKKLVKDGNI